MAFPSSAKTPVSELIQNITFANATLPIDRNQGLVIKVAPLTGNLVLATPINMVAGDVIKYYFTQDAIGGRSVIFPGALSFGAGTANQKFVVAFDYDGTNYTEVLTDGGLTGFGIPSIEVIDDDTFATATSLNVPSSESVKAYVDAQTPNNPAAFIYTNGVLTSSTDTVTGEVTNFIYTNGVLTSLTVTLGASVKTQTFTYTNGVLTAVSALA